MRRGNRPLRAGPRARKLVAQTSPADRVMEILRPEKIEKLGEGRYRVDFGEEISGWVRLPPRERDGRGRTADRHPLPLRVAQRIEQLYDAGRRLRNPIIRALRWYVFREVEIDGWPGELSPGQITAEAVYTDVSSTGRFERFEPLVQPNQPHMAAQPDGRRVTADIAEATVRTASGRPKPATGRLACADGRRHNFEDAAAFYRQKLEFLATNLGRPAALQTGVRAQRQRPGSRAAEAAWHGQPR